MSDWPTASSAAYTMPAMASTKTSGASVRDALGNSGRQYRRKP